MRRASISVQQVGRGQPRSLRCDGYAGDAPQVDKFSSSRLRVFGVAVDRERSLTASPIARVETDDHPDLPDSRRSLPERSSAALRSPLNKRRIPISRAHPYSYRDSYRDERTSRRRSAGSGKPSNRTFAGALGGTRIPNLLIRSHIAVSGVLTCGFAGQRRAKRGKLGAIAKPQVRGPVASVSRRLNP